MESARAFCKKKFGDLAIITGESERKFLWKQARNSDFPQSSMSERQTSVTFKMCI